jgi:hypothetical protein
LFIYKTMTSGGFREETISFGHYGSIIKCNPKLLIAFAFGDCAVLHYLP